MKRLRGYEAFYYRHNKDGELKGMISIYVDHFILAGNKESLMNITDNKKEKEDNVDGCVVLSRSFSDF